MATESRSEIEEKLKSRKAIESCQNPKIMSEAQFLDFIDGGWRKAIVAASSS